MQLKAASELSARMQCSFETMPEKVLTKLHHHELFHDLPTPRHAKLASIRDNLILPHMMVSSFFSLQ